MLIEDVLFQAWIRSFCNGMCQVEETHKIEWAGFNLGFPKPLDLGLTITNQRKDSRTYISFYYV